VITARRATTVDVEMASAAALQEAIGWVRRELGCEYNTLFGGSSQLRV
jgi:hypothetical protein